EDLVRERYEEFGYVLTRIGKPPKRAIPFCTEEPFDKITGNLIAPNGSEGQKIEFLGNGQQVVVAGIHPDTKQPYRWHGGEPGKIKREDLPYIRETGPAGVEVVRLLVDDLVALLIRDYGYKHAPGRPGEEGSTNDAPADIPADTMRVIREGVADDKLQASAFRNVLTVLKRLGLLTGHINDLFDKYPDGMARGYSRLQVERAYDKIGFPPPPLVFINMSNWDNEPVPDQEWTVLNRIPRQQCILFSGEGAAGSTPPFGSACAWSRLA